MPACPVGRTTIADAPAVTVLTPQRQFVFLMRRPNGLCTPFQRKGMENLCISSTCQPALHLGVKLLQSKACKSSRSLLVGQVCRRSQQVGLHAQGVRKPRCECPGCPGCHPGVSGLAASRSRGRRLQWPELI